ALGEEVEQPLEPVTLLIAVARPDALVARLAVLEVDPAEEKFEPALGRVPGVALEVEPDVAVVRRREEREPALGLCGQQLDSMLAGVSMVQLELGLVPNRL